MDSLVIDRFERQMDALLRRFERMKRDNMLLRTKQHALVHDRETMQTKQATAAAGIRKIIERLKALESEEI